MDKRTLRSTTAAPFAGLLDASGNRIAAARVVDIRALPEIDRRGFPALPLDMEMRLLTPANGADPSIVLFHPASEVHLEIPVMEMNSLEPHIEAVRFAVQRMAMGVPPDAP